MSATFEKAVEHLLVYLSKIRHQQAVKTRQNKDDPKWQATNTQDKH